MRFVATLLMWLVTTALLAVALPAAWAQVNVVDNDGYASIAQRAAADPALQAAMAAELTTQISALSSNVDPLVVSRVARGYVAGSAFPDQFAQANRFAHNWLFTDSIRSSVDPQGRWVIDFAPMLADSSFQQTLSSYGVSVPSSMPIPLSDTASATLRPGVLKPVASWGPWLTIVVVLLAGASAVLTLIVAGRKGKALAALGVSALLVGGAGWGAIELVRDRADQMLSSMSGNLREISAVMVSSAEKSMHQWLNVTLIVGVGLVVIGVIVTLLAGLAKSNPGQAPQG